MDTISLEFLSRPVHPRIRDADVANCRVSFRFRIAGARFCPLALLLSILTVLIDPRTLALRQPHPPLAVPHRIASYRIASHRCTCTRVRERWASDRDFSSVVGRKKNDAKTVWWFRFITNYPRAYCLLLSIQITTRIRRWIRGRILRPREKAEIISIQLSQRVCLMYNTNLCLLIFTPRVIFFIQIILWLVRVY